MQSISDSLIRKRMAFENPWWSSNSVDAHYNRMKPRAYLAQFHRLVAETDVQRAVVLMGPRRVGKTWLIHHCIQKLIDNGVDPRKICYVSLDAPVYIGKSIEDLLQLYSGIAGDAGSGRIYVFFDEIQYLKAWEVHLKRMVEDHREARFIASGSAAAALKLKSRESGAGRFTDFFLPPLTFYEYLLLLGRDRLVSRAKSVSPKDVEADIPSLNREFIDYVNFGGYPEALFSEAIKADPQRFIRSDIIDKVLLRDLPSLYGIQDIQELNRLFAVLAYNTGQEVSLESLSTGSGVAKNTIKKYLEYLEAAFLIMILQRVDQTGRRFRRANYFKVYLTSPSMRCAMFEPATYDHPAMGHLTETAIISQWLHGTLTKSGLHYARFKGGGEVDVVMMTGNRITIAVEIKWSDHHTDHLDELNCLIEMSRKHNLRFVIATTRDTSEEKIVRGVNLRFIQSSLYCYIVGRNSIETTGLLREHPEIAKILTAPEEVDVPTK